MKIVRATDSHPTADWVYAQVQKRLPNISLGTVYRNLNQLVEQRELSCIRDGTVVRYDGRTDKHHHFRCTVCGSLSNVEIPELEFLTSLRKMHSFAVSDFTVGIMGVCKACLESRNSCFR